MVSISPINNKTSLYSLILTNRAQIMSFGVNRIGLFVRNEQTDKSDVDLLVEFEKGKKSFDNFMHLSFLLEELCGRKVEVVTPESLNKYFAPQILSEVEYVRFTN